MKAITYYVTLQEPLIATAQAGDANSSATLDYLPGGMLRGALIGQYLRTRNNVDISRDPRARRLFLSAATRYLHAYPLDSNRHRGLPTPRTLLAFKRDLGTQAENNSAVTAYDASAPRDPGWLRDLEGDEGDELVPLPPPFAATADYICSTLQPARTLDVHIQRDRVHGRPMPANGAIFQYEALDAGQVFAGAVLFDETVDEKGVAFIEGLLDTAILRLGRSRTAQYATAIISDVRIHDNWLEAARDSTARLTVNTQLTLTCLSETLLRSCTGDGCTTIDDATLGAYLGVAVTVEPDRTFTAPATVGGFNRMWKLPLPQSEALAAGSVIGFRLGADWSDVARRQIEEQGLGERRAEGYGRVTCRASDHETYTAQRGVCATGDLLRTPSTPTFKEDSEGRRLAERMACRRTEAFVQGKIARYVSLAKPELTAISGSQLQRIAALVHATLAAGGNDFTTLRREIAGFRALARQQFAQARIENMSLADWLEQAFGDNTFKTFVADKIGQDPAQTVADVTAPWTDVDTRRTALRLVSAVLARMTDQRTRKG